MAGYELPVIQDDLDRDRTRIFHEFLSDEVSLQKARVSLSLTSAVLTITSLLAILSYRVAQSITVTQSRP